MSIFYPLPFSGTCDRRRKEPQNHVWLDGCFRGDGRSICRYCFKRKRKRKPKAE